VGKEVIVSTLRTRIGVPTLRTRIRVPSIVTRTASYIEMYVHLVIDSQNISRSRK